MWGEVLSSFPAPPEEMAIANLVNGMEIVFVERK